MDSEPKRPIEDMLEASARTRREAFGPDPMMPNPMRARLHDEIALGQSMEPALRSSWLQMFWPRLGLAAAMATLLVIGPVMWWRGSNRQAMQVAGPDVGKKSAMAESAAPADEIVAREQAVVAVATPNVNLTNDKRTTLEPQQTPAFAAAETAKDSSDVFADAPTAAAPAPAAPAPPVVMKGFITKEARAPESQSPAPAIAAASAVAAARARTDEARQATSAAAAQTNQAAAGSAPGASATYRFSQQPVGQPFQNTVQRRQLANVLNNFEVQQQGNEIRVVDSDGSTYTGQLEPVKRLTERSARAKYAARAEESKAEAGAATRFRATGFNVSLRKSLVFEGNLSQTPVQAKSKSPNDAAKADANAEPSRIIGTARVAGEAPVEVDARPVPVEKFER